MILTLLCCFGPDFCAVSNQLPGVPFCQLLNANAAVTIRPRRLVGRVQVPLHRQPSLITDLSRNVRTTP